VWLRVLLASMERLPAAPASLVICCSILHASCLARLLGMSCSMAVVSPVLIIASRAGRQPAVGLASRATTSTRAVA
jgi:hypothetical protein